MIKTFFILLPLALCADLTLTELSSKPKGHVRDFHIWQFMQTDINATQADAAYSLVDRYNPKIFKAYAQKTDNTSIKKQYRCKIGDIGFLLDETNASCINSGLDYTKAMKLTNAQREKFSKLLKDEYPRKSDLLSIMNKKPFLQNLLDSGSDNYIKLFNDLGKYNRQTYFNVKLSKAHINQLAKAKGFSRAIKLIVTDERMDKMQETLLELDPQELSAQSYLFLALNALKFKAINKANHYLEISYNKAYYQMDKDRALFWQYKILNEHRYLKQLSLSTDINIYSLLAKEKLHIETENYFSKLELKDAPSEYDFTDPYVWQEVLNKIRATDKDKLQDLTAEFATKSDEVANAFIYSKARGYKVHNYIMPYKQATNALSSDDKALIYALGRQESHFIPSALSRSFAMGVMQMMPFLVKDLARQKKEQIQLQDMFDPYKNIEYSVLHLKYLQKHLYHPLFIAYAYNGGIGFTKRYLLEGNFSTGNFEPYLSMELMANTESREYAKKVLANYVIYKKILGDEVKISALFETLSEPIYTDKFRTKAYAKGL